MKSNYYLVQLCAVKLALWIRHSLDCKMLRVSCNALVKFSVPEIPLKRELTANCPVETHSKLRKLIPAVMVDYGLHRVHLPL